MTDGESDPRTRAAVLAGLAALAVFLGVLTWYVAAQPAYGERCAVRYAEGTIDWRVCIQRLRMGGRV
jgi:hypothetical protein